MAGKDEDKGHATAAGMHSGAGIPEDNLAASKQILHTTHHHTSVYLLCGFKNL